MSTFPWARYRSVWTGSLTRSMSMFHPSCRPRSRLPNSRSRSGSKRSTSGLATLPETRFSLECAGASAPTLVRKPVRHCRPHCTRPGIFLGWPPPSSETQRRVRTVATIHKMVPLQLHTNQCINVPCVSHGFRFLRPLRGVAQSPGPVGTKDRRHGGLLMVLWRSPLAAAAIVLACTKAPEPPSASPSSPIHPRTPLPPEEHRP